MFYIVFVFIFVLLIYLGSISYRSNPNKATNKYFSYLCFFVAIWTFFYFFENEVGDLIVAKLFLYLDFIFGVFMVYYFFLFIAAYTTSEIIKYKTYVLIYTIFIDCLLIFGLIIKDISWMNNVLVFKLQPLFFLYALQPFTLTILSLVIFIKKVIISRGFMRMQFLYSLSGLLLSSIIILTTTQILPQFGVIDINVSRIGITGILFFIIFTAYAILKYRLMDIRVIIRRSAVFTVIVAIITSVYALLAYLISVFFQGIIGTQSIILNGVITAVLVAIGFEPLKKWLSEITDRFLFKAEYHPQEVIAEFSDNLSATLDLSVLAKFITSRLHEVFKPQYVSLFLLNEKTKQYERKINVGKVVRKIDKIEQKLFNNIFNYLKKLKKEKEIFVREEINKLNEELQNDILELFYEELDKHGVNLVVPIYLQDKLVGILFLGDKKSGDVYSLEDLRILEIISKQAAVAIQNSLLFEEQKQFANKLKIEVAKATKELKEANVQLKKLDKAKSEFISIASHQLRTPLTVIKGYISMINQGDYGKVPEKIAVPLSKAFQNTMRIITLVEDLLNISRIESGRMKYEFEKINLVDLVNEVFEELAHHAKMAGLKFELEKPKEKIPDLILDRKKVREVVMNLMDNSIKYTKKGFVKVKVERENNSVVYSVTDSGRGLAEEEIPMLFKKFSRAGGAQLVHTEGTGLGLFIAKQIIQKHGGEIWAASEGKGKGSTFAIRFEIKNPKLAKELKKKK